MDRDSLGHADHHDADGSPPAQYFARFKGRLIGPLSRQAFMKLRARGTITQFHEISTDQIQWFLASEFPWASAALPVAVSSPNNSPSQSDHDFVELTGGCAEDAAGNSDLAFSDIEPGIQQRFTRFDEERDRLAVFAPWAVICGVAALCAVVLLSIAILHDGQPPPQGSSVAPTKQPVPKAPEPASKEIPTPIASRLELVPTAARFVAGPTDEKGLEEAVGLVVGGFELSVSGLDTPRRIERAVSSGSCFAITPNGCVVTNRHVVELIERAEGESGSKQLERLLGRDAKPRVWVFFAGVKSSATIQYVSERYDLAILKVDTPPQTVFRLASSSKLTRGHEVYAAGFPGIARTAVSLEELSQESLFEMGEEPDVRSRFRPRDFEFTLTKGILSRVYAEANGRCWIQHEAVVRHGNSGGPLLDADGVVIGINTQIQKNEEGDVQTNLALDVAQLRAEIEANTIGTVWAAPRSAR